MMDDYCEEPRVIVMKLSDLSPSERAFVSNVRGALRKLGVAGFQNSCEQAYLEKLFSGFELLIPIIFCTPGGECTLRDGNCRYFSVLGSRSIACVKDDHRLRRLVAAGYLVFGCTIGGAYTCVNHSVIPYNVYSFSTHSQYYYDDKTPVRSIITNLNCNLLEFYQFMGDYRSSFVRRWDVDLVGGDFTFDPDNGPCK